MSTELINRITVKKSGVYISSHSSNDDSPFRSWRCDSLSEIYDKEGQRGLDREIVYMLLNYCQLRGRHASVERYRRALESNQAKEIQSRFVEQTNDRFKELSEEERRSFWREEYSGKAGEYREFEQAQRAQMCAAIVGLLEEIPETVVFSGKPWYTESWYDEDIAAAMEAAGVVVTQANLAKARDKCRAIFDDKSERNEMLKCMVESIFDEGC